MKIAVYSAHDYDRDGLTAANATAGHDLLFIKAPLSAATARQAAGCGGACIFVNDHADAEALRILAEDGVHLLALRCAGFNNVDTAEAKRLGISVTRVGDYSPHSVAEHATALLLALNRNIPIAHERVLANDFHLDGLMGFDLYGKTIGIIGAGRIGAVFAGIMRGFGCTILAYDAYPDPEFARAGARFVTLAELAAQSDAISLHCPLTTGTKHLLDADFFAACKPGVLLVNTSRGPVLDTQAALAALRSGHLGGLALDVYEFEAGLFFEDHSQTELADPLLAELQQLPNVLITGHQGFFTREAFRTICQTSIDSFSAYERGEPLANRIPD